MSLINQMLRDLEERNQAATKVSAPQPLDIPLLRQPPHVARRYAWLFVSVLLSAGWLLWDWTATPDTPAVAPPEVISKDPPPTVAPVTVQPTPTLPTELERTEPVTPAPISVEATVTENIPLTTAAQPATPIPAAKAQPEVVTALPVTRPATPLTTPKPAATSMINRAEALYRQAENSSSRLMRKENLREVLQIAPRHLPAREKLLNILVQEHSTLELKQFLDESLALFPNQLGFITTLAHYHVQQKDFAAAIAVLERIDSFSITEPNYLALLAASYQQQHLYDKALPIYQKLSRLQAEKAEHWLGLGICADKLQQPYSAAQAYQRALDKSTLSNAVVDYIKQRLSSLPH